MFKRLFQPTATGNGTLSNQPVTSAITGSNHCPGCAKPETTSTAKGKTNGCGISSVSFEEIYRNDPAKPAESTYSILKVAEMMKSAHLAGMSPEAKQCSILMALEAAGVDVDNLLHDATLRQRALNDYEEEQRAQVRDFEAGKARESAAARAELDRITADYLRRIQSMADEVAQRHEQFEAWQKRKQQEVQRIVEASALCSRTPTVTPTSNSLTTLLERAAAARG